MRIYTTSMAQEHEAYTCRRWAVSPAGDFEGYLYFRFEDVHSDAFDQAESLRAWDDDAQEFITLLNLWDWTITAD